MSSEILVEDKFEKFVHLHCHSDYSLYDGFQKVSAMVKKAKNLNMKAIALTDHGKVGGFIKFYKACRTEGINSIFGCETYICHDLQDKKSKRYHLTILAKNNDGYKNLLKLSSISHNYIARVGNNEIPRINFPLLKEYSSGLIVLSGCMSSEFSKKIIEDKDISQAEKLASDYKIIWGDDYYIEVMETGYPGQKEHLQQAYKIAKKLGIKMVVTNDCHFSEKGDAKYQITKISINRNRPYKEDSPNVHYYIKNYDEMIAR
jgi:DNA polymerase-3 subunit alpha